MAIKIIENENGTVTEKTSKQIKRERKLHKFQKTAGVAGFTAAMLAASSLSVFAANGENAAPSNVSTSTMSTMINIIMWIVLSVVSPDLSRSFRDSRKKIPVIVTTVSYLWLLQASLLRLHSLLPHLSIRKQIHNLTWKSALVSEGRQEPHFEGKEFLYDKTEQIQT